MTNSIRNGLKVTREFNEEYQVPEEEVDKDEIGANFLQAMVLEEVFDDM